MSTDEPFWLNDPTVLFKNPFQVAPSNDLSRVEKLNAIARSALWTGLALYFLCNQVGCLGRTKCGNWWWMIIVLVLVVTVIVKYGCNDLVEKFSDEKKDEKRHGCNCESKQHTGKDVVEKVREEIEEIKDSEKESEQCLTCGLCNTDRVRKCDGTLECLCPLKSPNFKDIEEIKNDKVCPKPYASRSILSYDRSTLAPFNPSDRYRNLMYNYDTGGASLQETTRTVYDKYLQDDLTFRRSLQGSYRTQLRRYGRCDSVFQDP